MKYSLSKLLFYFKYTHKWTLHHTLSILLCPYLGINLYIFCYMNIWTYKTSKERTAESACKQKHCILAPCIIFINTWMWHQLKITNILNKKLKKTMNWIQNDNQNVDGVDKHPEAWQSLLPLHWWGFINNVTVLMCFMSDDRVWLCVEASVVFGFFFTCVFGKFCTEHAH